MRSINLLFMFFVFVSLSLGQQPSTSHPFSNSWAASVEGGITIGATDFPEIKMDYSGWGSIEYFLPTSSSSVFGVRLFGGAGYVAGKGLSSNLPDYVNIDEFRTKIVYGGLGLFYSLSLGKVVQPYLSGAISYLMFDPMDKNGIKMPRNASGEYATDDKDYMGEVGIRFLFTNYLSFNVGYTLNYFINDNIDDVYNANDDAFHSIFGGISYYFLSFSDADGDGIKDSKDMCDNTPEGVLIDEFGCPLDSDFDKVPDYLDLCSNTPNDVVVDSDGCPIDSDKDGLADYLDECPKSAENVIVDERGCEKIIVNTPLPKIKEEDLIEEERLILVLSGTANFESGKAELLPNPKSGLNRLSDFMKTHLNTKWIIEGHTDNLGVDDANTKLSLDRAKSVLYYFRNKGLNKDRFELIGSGSSKPVADNSIEFGRTLNRRVVIEEKVSYEEREQMMRIVQSNEYNLSAEYNIESLIFTDGTYYCVQVSSWRTKLKAEKEVEKLVAEGHSAFIESTKSIDKDEKWFRVRIGYFDNLMGTREYLKYIR